ncbi:hypothetical protein [Flavobacterium sp. GCM10027622]|uniref:hypothetical protein n=1 Tax=unclassified Flavobacterium TaxID=196869 RepID=UPI0036245274
MVERHIKTISVKVESTNEGIAQVIAGNTLITIAEMYKKYNDAIDMYKKDGYTISHENPKEFSFQARKEYYVETED